MNRWRIKSWISRLTSPRVEKSCHTYLNVLKLPTSVLKYTMLLSYTYQLIQVRSLKV